MRNLKTLGVALVATFALSALMVSVASANTATVVGGHEVHGEDTEALTETTGSAVGIKCQTATYNGTAIESTITLGLTFEECLAAGVAPVTVTDNDCSYEITLGTLDGHSAPGTLRIECPTGQQIIKHIYNGVPHSPANSVCTVEIPPQTDLTGLTVTDETNGHLLIEGMVAGLTNYLEGPCATTASGGLAHTINPGNSSFHVSITLGVAPTGGGGGIGLG